MQIVRGDQIDFIPATKNHLIDGRVQMVNWSRLPAGKSFQPHYHEDMQEVFIILNGTVEMTVTDMTCELNGGDAILISPKEIHQMKNTCDDAVDYVVFGISTEQGGKTVNV